MDKNNDTRRSLRASALSLLLCVAMLIGTTFAWFTDSVTNSGNKIEAGNLKISLEEWDGEGYKPVGETPIFDYSKWEPGYTEIAAVKIVNNGSLALKYIVDFVTDKDAEDAMKLASVIDVYYIKDGNAENGMPENLSEFTKVGTLDQFLNNKEGVATGHLEENGNADYAMIALHMQESAGNEYQNLSTGAFDIVVRATQYAHEADGFGNSNYDEDADYPVNSSSDLSDAIGNANEGDTIIVNEGSFELENELTKGVQIVGSGPDKTTLITGENGYTITGDNVLIKNVKVDGGKASNVNYGGALNLKGNNATVENSIIQGGGKQTYGASVFVNLQKGETAYIKNTTISGAFRGVFLGSQAGNVEISGCNINATYPLSVDGGGDFTITVKDSELNGWTSYGEVANAVFTNTKFGKSSSGYEFARPYANTTFENCTFSENFKIGAGVTGKTYTFNNCVSGTTKLTADNIQELLLDMTEEPLKGCTLLVDGQTVTLK